MTAMQQSNAQLKESIQSDLHSVKLDLKANQERFYKFQEKLENFQKEVRLDIHSETQKVLKTFETQTQGLRKEFGDKLEAETRRVSQMVSQVQAETTAELAAVKQQLQGWVLSSTPGWTTQTPIPKC
jgi:competence CoiA-like predicted nuclease